MSSLCHLFYHSRQWRTIVICLGVTITNLGMYNIDAFTPIINLPQCAILGVGRIVEKPAVYQEQIVPRHLVALSLTFDHRVVDGAPAVRFLDLVRSYVSEPLLWLVE